MKNNFAGKTVLDSAKDRLALVDDPAWMADDFSEIDARFTWVIRSPVQRNVFLIKESAVWGPAQQVFRGIDTTGFGKDEHLKALAQSYGNAFLPGQVKETVLALNSAYDDLPPGFAREMFPDDNVSENAGHAVMRGAVTVRSALEEYFRRAPGKERTVDLDYDLAGL